MANEQQDKLLWYKNYLEGYFKDFKLLLKDKECLEYFKSLNIYNKFSYLVFSENFQTLRKFATFYLILKYVRFQTVNMYDFASDICDNKDELFEKEVMILFNHRHILDVGNTENWLLSTILNKVATRNREGYRTLVLTERRLPTFEKSGEFNFIELRGVSSPIQVTSNVDDGRRD